MVRGNSLLEAGRDTPPSRWPRIRSVMAMCLMLTSMSMGDVALGARSLGARSGGASRPVTYDDLVGITDLGIWSQDDFAGPAIAPDGHALAVEVTRANLELNRTDVRWLVVSLRRNGEVIEAGDGGEPIPFVWHGFPNGNSLPEPPQWSPDSNWIYYRVKRNGEIQLWRGRQDGKVQQQLTHSNADIESFHVLDSRRVVFVVRQPRNVGKQRLLDEGNRGLLYDDRFIPVFSRRPLVDPEVQEPRLWVYETETGIERSATDQECQEYAKAKAVVGVDGHPRASWVRQTSDRGVTVWLDDLRPSGHAGVNMPKTIVVRMGEGGTRDLVCVSPRCTGHFKGIWLAKGGTAVYFLRWDDAYDYGPIGLYRWDIKSNAISKLLRTDDLIEGCGLTGMRLVCSHESATTPRDIISIDLRTGRRTPIFDPNPTFSHLQFGQIVPLNWVDPQGVRGFGHLVKPVGYQRGRRYPLVIVQYRSRGFLRGGVGDEYPIHVLAARGFAVLSFHRPDDWKLMAESNSAEEVKAKGMVDFEDRRMVLSVLEAGIDLLDRLGVIDPQRVGITGLSDGGETVGFALIHAPNRFAAAAASGTAWNPIGLFLGGPENQTWLRHIHLDYLSDKAAADRWRDISLGLNAERVRAPLLLQVSDSEYEQEIQTVAALSGAGKAVEMYVFPDEYHIKSLPAHRYSIYRRNVQWFELWLQGVEDPDPVDSSQYARWRRLRSLDSPAAKQVTVH